jgi:hypothetical protein
VYSSGGIVYSCPVDEGTGIVEGIHQAAPTETIREGTTLEPTTADPSKEGAAPDSSTTEPEAAAEAEDSTNADTGFGELDSEKPSEDETLNNLIEPSTPDGATESTPESESTPPADAPADDKSLDDIFKDSTSTNPPSGEETRVTTQADEAIEEASEPVEPPAAEEPSEDLIDSSEGDDELDNLFKDNSSVRPSPTQTQTLSSVHGDSSNDSAPAASERKELPLREWIDNTGTYSTVGRLVQVTETHVRLLKLNGRFTTVAKFRLCVNDLRYAEQNADGLSADVLDAVALR